MVVFLKVRTLVYSMVTPRNDACLICGMSRNTAVQTTCGTYETVLGDISVDVFLFRQIAGRGYHRQFSGWKYSTWKTATG